MKKQREASKSELNREIEARFGFRPSAYCGWYGILSWTKPNLFALRKIFSLTNMHVNTEVTQCCLTKPQMAFQLEQAYGHHGLKFTPHEINYISREGFIVLYNNLIEGVK